MHPHPAALAEVCDGVQGINTARIGGPGGGDHGKGQFALAGIFRRRSAKGGKVQTERCIRRQDTKLVLSEPDDVQGFGDRGVGLVREIDDGIPPLVLRGVWASRAAVGP